MKAVIIYDTRYGNTEIISKSLATGLGRVLGARNVVCINAKTASMDAVAEGNLVCIGGPTEGFSATKPIRKIFDDLKGVNLGEKFCFAFDTRLDSRLSGSAAKYIQKEFTNLGLNIGAPYESATVHSIKERGSICRAKLKEGEEKRFEEIGYRLANLCINNGAHNQTMGANVD